MIYKILASKIRPVILMILDGYGNTTNKDVSAIAKANTPNLDRIAENYPKALLEASGLAVGLPEGIMGNSDVGHLNLGAGRRVVQDLPRINEAIEDGSIYKNGAFLSAIEHAKKNNSALNLIGLLSDGKVHSSNQHLYGLLNVAKKEGVKKVNIHVILDGRDTKPNIAAQFVEELEAKIKEIGIGQIASLSGRFYTMDRDNRWERVKVSYDMLTTPTTESVDPLKYLSESVETDEFIKPILTNPNGAIQDNDSIVFFNYRADRAREISYALIQPDFIGFDRAKTLSNVKYVSMTQYDEDKLGPNVVDVLFQKQKLTNVLGELVAKAGLSQLRIAETEKFNHVTFFFDGGEDRKLLGADRILVESPKEVATYDEKPEMSAYGVTKKLLEAIGLNQYHLIVLNFANCDMVGHTGRMGAAVKAVEAVDDCVGQVVSKVLKANGAILLTADHGNAEKMIAEDGSPHTAHTTSQVPVYLVSNDANSVKLNDGKLANVAPTLLELLKIKKPTEMTEDSLIVQ